MKFTSILIALLIIIGCVGPAKFTIPDEPTFRQAKVIVFEEGIFFEKKDVEIFVDNVRLLKAYADELRRMLIDIQKDDR
uniref:Uncharacterized protein n=1 Tax=viral metagenome TaxID=1070528 RepID=A0A6H1ZKB2_9ZZZZ